MEKRQGREAGRKRRASINKGCEFRVAMTNHITNTT